jgi:hypothetical protein
MQVFRSAVSDETARFYMALMLFTLVFEIVSGLLFIDLPQSNREVLIGIGGTIVGGLISSANYYNKTGVSNDRMKDDTLNKAITTAASIQQEKNPAPVTVVQPGETHTVAAATQDNGKDPRNGD